MLVHLLQEALPLASHLSLLPLKEVEQNLGVESMGETEEGKARLEVEVERFIKRTKDK